MLVIVLPLIILSGCSTHDEILMKARGEQVCHLNAGLYKYKLYHGSWKASFVCKDGVVFIIEDVNYLHGEVVKQHLTKE